MASITFKVRVAWWLPLYLKGVQFTAETFGMEPDWAKVYATCMRAIKLTVAK
ncbi:MAG: hypothetical protein V4669_13760 [Pseudomonadota bacterium]